MFLIDRDLHNFADDNNISAVSETIPELVDSLTSKSNLAIDWFNSNSMIVNPDKFKVTVLTKSRQDTSGIQISLKDHCITSENTVTLQGIKIDSRLSFEKHVSKLCKTAASKLNASRRLRPYIISEKTRKILIQSFVSCHFNYFPLVWYFTTAKHVQKLEKIQERALRFITDDYISTYENLLINTGVTSTRMGQIQKLCIEIYKTLSNINLL